ncbi:MAG: hypothetical protein R3D63_10905 [Paracoccaceae bacterium]
MNQTFLALSLGLAGVVLAAHAAFAEGAAQCGPRDAVVAELADRFGETRRSLGLTASAVVEVYASSETGSWTIAVTTPDGTMCLVAAGRDFQADPPQTPARGMRI